VTALVVTVALLGLCAGVAAAPMNVPTRTNELDETPGIISGDLDFSAPLIGPEVVFDPYSDVLDDADPLAILPLNTTLAAPEPSAALLFAMGLACLAALVTIPGLVRLLQSLKKPRRPGRRRVRRELRMMA
jgi:hypothetical protein